MSTRDQEKEYGTKLYGDEDTETVKDSRKSLTKVQCAPFNFTFTTGFSASRIPARHSIRPFKAPIGLIA